MQTAGKEIHIVVVVRHFTNTVRSALWALHKRRFWRFAWVPLFPFLLLLLYFPRGRIRYHASRRIQKILIVHFGSIGDFLMCTPALRLLRENHPNAQVHAIVANHSVVEALRQIPLIDTWEYLEQFPGADVKGPWDQERSELQARWWLFVSYPLLVFKTLIRRYDAGIGFGPFPHAGSFAALLFHLSGIPLSSGCMGNYMHLLTHRSNVEIFEERWTNIYLQTVAPFVPFVTAVNYSYLFEVDPFDEAHIGMLLTRLGITNKKPLVVLHPGGGLYVNSKRWDPEKFAQIADYFAVNSDAQVLITGSADERDLAEQVAARMKARAHVLAGTLSLGQMAALLKRVDLVVTNDTGILHLADAVGASRIVSIFGPTNAEKIAPSNERNLVVRSRLFCSPCIVLDAGDPTRRCWREIKEECLHSIPASTVIREISAKWPELKEFAHKEGPTSTKRLTGSVANLRGGEL